MRSARRIEDRIAATAGDAGGFEGFNLPMRRRIPDGQRRGGDDGADHPADEPGFEVRNLRPDLGEAGPELVGGDVVAVLERCGAEPLHADDGDQTVWMNAADGAVRVKVFKPHSRNSSSRRDYPRQGMGSTGGQGHSVSGSILL